MNFGNLLKVAKILRFIEKNPNCNVPAIRAFLGLKHSDPPSQEEKNLYRLISSLNESGLVEKVHFKKRELGGAHFYLRMTLQGQDFFKQLGVSRNYIDPSEKERLMKEMETSIRLEIRNKLKGKVSKPLSIVLLPNLTSGIMKALNSMFKDITIIEQ